MHQLCCSFTVNTFSYNVSHLLTAPCRILCNAYVFLACVCNLISGMTMWLKLFTLHAAPNMLCTVHPILLQFRIALVERKQELSDFHLADLIVLSD